MTLEEMKIELDKAQTDLALKQSAIKARTEQARELNRKNYEYIAVSSSLRTRIAQLAASIVELEKAQPAGA